MSINIESFEKSIIKFTLKAECRISANDIDAFYLKKFDMLSGVINDIIQDNIGGSGIIIPDSISIMNISTTKEVEKAFLKFKEEQKKIENAEIQRQIDELDKKRKELEAKLK